MSEYQAAMQSLMARSIVTLALIYLLVLLVVAAIWMVPWCLQKKSRKKKPKKKNRAVAKKSLQAQVVLTLIVLLPTLLTIPGISKIKAMKRDMDTDAYVTYTGSYQIAYQYRAQLSDLWLDLRAVYLEDSDEWVYMDMSDVWEGWAPDSGTYQGHLVYGQNSKYIVKIQG